MRSTEDDAVADPKWWMESRGHCWRNFISAEIKAAWFTFTEEQRRMLFRQAQENELARDWNWDD